MIQDKQGNLITDRLELKVISNWLWYEIDRERTDEELAHFCETIIAVLQAVTSVSGLPVQHFFLFDKIAYFL